MAISNRLNRAAMRQASRSTTHLVLGIITMLGVGLAALAAPNFDLRDLLIIGLAYVSLLFTVVTLLIGPLYMWRRGRVPTNLDIRRDVGIWAAATSIVHVALVFWGRDLGLSIRYFLGQVSLFGLVNWLGLIATVIMLALLFTSNDLMLRKLRGGKWKLLQRFNYLLLLVAVLHTFGEEYVWRRGWGIVSLVIALTLITFAAQAVGFIIYRRRQRLRLAIGKQNNPTLPS